MENKEALECLLAWLGPDGVSGARKYEEVRERLIRLFRFRGCQSPEDLADETIDRVARAAMKADFRLEGTPIAYFRGVARNVHLEWLRTQRRFVKEPIGDVHTQLPWGRATVEDEEIMADYLERCLELLSTEKRTLLLRYYECDKRAKIDTRKALAEQEGMGLNALRIQVFRLRNTVRECVERRIHTGEIERRPESSYL